MMVLLAQSGDALGAMPGAQGGDGCDFCNWRELTAECTWGRLEETHAVSASNLFKVHGHTYFHTWNKHHT